MAEVYLGVGGNLEPQRSFPQALALLRAANLAVSARAPVVCSAAIDRPEQPAYRNTVWRIETGWSAELLKAQLRAIEARCGRTRSADRYAARPIDLDILLYDGRILDEDIATRACIAQPLLALLPDCRIGDDRLAALPVATAPPLPVDAELTRALEELP